MSEEKKGHPEFNFTVDDEPYTTNEHILTPSEILLLAGLTPANYYLVEIQGHHQVSFKEKPDESIHMHENMKFISIFIGETPVS